jgi:hemerythrin
MEWTQEFETGIPSIDAQHRQIVEFINGLDEAMRTGDKDGIERVLEGVLNYTVTHFEFEEDLMQKAGFPGLKAHQQSHEFFMRKVSVLRGRFNAGEDVATVLQNMLKGWLVSHIKGEDREYIEAVKKVTGDA